MRKRALCNLSKTKAISCNMGMAIPCYAQEVLPGDTWSQKTAALVRFSAMVAPIMHKIDLRIHHFYVPNRLTWNAAGTDNWETFITGGDDGQQAPTFPTMVDTNVNVGTLGDYMGVGSIYSTPGTVSALPFRAYAMIWNEFFRDKDLQTAATIDLTGGADTTTTAQPSTIPAPINWQKDYFTTLRTTPQKGSDVVIPFSDPGEVDLISGTGTMLVKRAATRAVYDSAGLGSSAAGILEEAGDGTDLVIDPNGQLQVDPTVGINWTDVRAAGAAQRFMEARSRYGSDYRSYLRSWGVKPQDSRLQLPEYLGGGSFPLQVSEVLQTGVSVNGDDEAIGGLGNLGGHGIGGTQSNRFKRTFPEHGYVISIFSARPKNVYMEAIPRHFLKRTKEDFYTPELEDLGQQIVTRREVQGRNASPTALFGYGPRYSEYKSDWSDVGGLFRDSLKYWHLARNFANDTLPTIDATFVTCTPRDDIFAIQAYTDQVYVRFTHSVFARRRIKPGIESRVL